MIMFDLSGKKTLIQIFRIYLRSQTVVHKILSSLLIIFMIVEHISLYFSQSEF